MRFSPRHRLGASAAALALALLAVSGCAGDKAPASSPTQAAEPTTDPTGSPGTSSPTDEPTATTSVPVYFVTDSPAGPRLVREFHRVGGDPLTEAAKLVLGAGQPDDPDYRTLWPLVDVSSVTVTDGVLVVEMPHDGFTDRPDGMSGKEARLALQQLVYTLQGVQQDRLPVRVERNGSDSRLLGISTEKELTAGSPLETLNHVNITAPTQGQAVSGPSVAVSGVANSFEANVVCELVADGAAVSTTPITAEGWMEDKLFPFEGEVEIPAGVTGDVTLRCSTDDPSGGEEGFGPFTDTKLVRVG